LPDRYKVLLGEENRALINDDDRRLIERRDRMGKKNRAASASKPSKAMKLAGFCLGEIKEPKNNKCRE
jgi:hypothetical protein